MRLNIRTKVFLAVASALVIIFALVMYLLVTENANQLRSDLNRESNSFASLATTPIGNTFILYQNSGTSLIGQQINNYLELDSDVTNVSVISISGKVLYNNQFNSAPKVSSSVASSFKPVYKSSNGYVQQIVEPLVESGGVHRYAIVYQISTNRVERNVRSVIRLILVIGLGVLALSIAVTDFLLNRLFIRPIRELSESADIISSGNYEQQILANNKDEIGSLANSLNKMAGSLKADIVKLKDLDKMKSEFMMITSHNLRTPLTIIRGYIEMATETTNITELNKIISTISEGVDRLHLIAENMLTIATLEAGSGMNRQPARLKAFVGSIGNEFSSIAIKQNLSWNFSDSIDDKAELDINQASLRSALVGVIDNAIKFTKPGGQVTVIASLDERQFKFSVRDTGIGIDEVEIPKLFTKFHRGTDTLQYDYEGLGIGLYLSKLIINQHDGEIEIESHKGQGTSCVVTIPANKPAASSRLPINSARSESV
jgi:signal transduction histidine kinase